MHANTFIDPVSFLTDGSESSDDEEYDERMLDSDLPDDVVANDTVFSCPFLTPQSLASAYEARSACYRFNQYNVQFVPNKTMTRYRLNGDEAHSNFYYGHPCATLNPGSMIQVFHSNQSYFIQLKDINVDTGELIFEHPQSLPTFYVDSFGGSLEKQKIFTNLLDLEKTWSDKNSLAPMLFNKSMFAEELVTDNTRVVLTQGVVGSGKTYTMVQDIIRHKNPVTYTVVVAETNEALTTVGLELEKQKVQPVHFTFKDHPFSQINILKGHEAFERFRFWHTHKATDPEEKSQKAYDLATYRAFLRDKVILATPSKVITLRRSLGLDSPMNIYLDESGLMKFITFTAVLPMNINKLWAYGDYEQNKPYSEYDRIVPPEDIYYIRAAMAVSEAGDQSVSEWLHDMGCPQRNMRQSRRIPPQDADAIIPFFYDMAAGHELTAQWLESNEMDVEFRIAPTTYTPRALQTYPYMTQNQKDKEASRMRKILDRIMVDMFAAQDDQGGDTVVRVKKRSVPLRMLSIRRDLKPPDGSEKKDVLCFISPYTHLKDSLFQFIEVYYPMLKERFDLKFMSTRTAQGLTTEHVIFYLPNSPGLFVTDRQLLVAMSRHTRTIRVSPFKLDTLVPLPMLVQMSLLRLIDLEFKQVRRSKGGPAVGTVVTVNFRDPEKLRVFFSTKQFEFYRETLIYPYLKAPDKRRHRAFSKYGPRLVDAYVAAPSLLLTTGGKGEYKYALLKLAKHKVFIPTPKHKSGRIDTHGQIISCFDRSDPQDLRFSVPYNVSGEYYKKEKKDASHVNIGGKIIAARWEPKNPTRALEQNFDL